MAVASGTSGLARSFKKQQPALEYFQALRNRHGVQAGSIGLFAQEVTAQGARIYIVDRYEDFAAVHCGSDRHLYEVIVADHPCWLYFDFEFKASDTTPTFDMAMQDFYLVFRYFCAQVLSTDVDCENIVELDSSTPSKFSKHILVRSLAFADNLRMGRVVHLFKEFGKSHGLVDMVDASVYSRNRCFRLLGQSKFGRHTILRSVTGPGRSISAAQLLQSMVSFVPEGLAWYHHTVLDVVFPTSNAQGTTAKLPADPSTRRAPGATACNGILAEYLAEAWHTVRARALGIFPPRQTSVEAYFDVNGQFSTATFAKANTYCENVRREHSKNSVYVVIDHHNALFWQKCYSPGCKGFRSQRRCLPEWVVDSAEQAAELAAPTGAAAALPPSTPASHGQLSDSNGAIDVASQADQIDAVDGAFEAASAQAEAQRVFDDAAAAVLRASKAAQQQCSTTDAMAEAERDESVAKAWLNEATIALTAATLNAASAARALEIRLSCAQGLSPECR